MKNETYSLFELHEYIRRVLALNLNGSVWISCEISSVKASGGHRYLELVEKNDDEIIARANAILWKKNYTKLLAKLDFELQGLLQTGIQILAKVKVDFHEKYGLKLHIEDIDPAYSWGKMELKRRHIIQGLQERKLLNKNAQIALPVVLQKVAVISSVKAAGWKDFEQHLDKNLFDYRVDVQLFSARMQGEFLEADIIKQLDKIEHHRKRFDLVAIIRGGGSRLDLSWFDSQALGERIAAYSLPVFTGIGHETDETITDLVAHTALKTPTAVADKILETFRRFEATLDGVQQYMTNHIRQQLQTQNYHLERLTQHLQSQTKYRLQESQQMLDFIDNQLFNRSKDQLNRSKNQLHLLEKSCELLSPEFALKRGFTLTTKDGKPIVSAKHLASGARIETQFLDGKLSSKVE